MKQLPRARHIFSVMYGHHLPLPNLGVLCITDVACSLGTLVTLVFETGNRVCFPEYF